MQVGLVDWFFGLMMFLGLTVYSAAYGAPANPAPKSEVYSATEPEQAIDIRSRGRNSLKSVSTPKVTPVAATVPQSRPYDTVPSGQVEPLVERLKLAQALVVKFGRAYDYRAHTVKELRAILDQLESGGSNPAPAQGD